jgi:hypothetical protein
MRKARDGGYDAETGTRALSRRSGSRMPRWHRPLDSATSNVAGHLDSRPVVLGGSFDEIFHRRLKNAAVACDLAACEAG